ncbi:MAG: VRR-NUC domain-containing protein [Oscillospiraceae bacterium]|jgi:hypothetical protein|nr:VRR-NUC domain-containing protein [Oscillospiraceae bacterium]
MNPARMTAVQYRAELLPTNRSAAARWRDCPLESEEQAALFAWARLTEARHPELAYLVAVPNGGLRNAVTGARLKAEGTRKGFPDMILPVARGGYHALAIELKREKHGAVSPEQKLWLDALNKFGWLAVVCKGVAAAITVIEDYLRLEG